jgi:multiple sugar transport system substrate-binding protein
MGMRKRSTGLLAGLLATGLLCGGCVGKPATSQDTSRNADAKNVTLSIESNSIVGGKNASGADWITQWVIPQFTAMEKAKGVTVKVNFNGDGSDDTSFRQKMILNLRTGGGGDILEIDGTDVGDFATGDLIQPLDQVVGKSTVDAWDGWSEIPTSVQGLDTYNGQRYGIPIGTDGRVLFYNKKLFTQAGLPANWQPTSWADIISAAQALKKLPGVTPIQLDGGTAMGETTTMNGFLPTLAGAGSLVYDSGRWQGDTAAMRQTLGLYQQIYSTGLGDPTLQEEAKGRDQSFAEFAADKLGIVEESDYLWRSVVSPTVGIDKMADRDTAVGWARIPAVTPGAGVDGESFVSMSGGGVRVLNPHTQYPQQAWELLTFMNSAQATEVYEQTYLKGSTQIMQRTDVNNQLLASDPLLHYISTDVLPVTHYRPSDGNYPKVSQLLQQATADVISGKTPAQAAASYASALETAVGKANVVNN